MKNTAILIACTAAAALCCGCVKEESKSPNEAGLRFLESWVSENYPGVKASGNGIYILSDEPGSGAVAGDDMFIYADYTVTDLEGNISSTTSRRLGRQVGTGYSESNYYGPRVLVNTEGYTSAGLAQMLSGMKVGGTRKALIPRWLATTERYSDPSSYYKKKSTDYSNLIYTVTLRAVIDDVVSWQIDSLSLYLPGAIGQNVGDSLSFGFYYRSIRETGSGSEFPKDTTVYVNYVGRLLDGTVFDTNVADSAKFYGLYSSSRTYSPMKITWGEDYTGLNISTASSTGGSTESAPVAGFQKMLWEMGPYEKGVGVFYSVLGYGYSGSGNTIPPFSPLRFDLELVDSQ